MNWKNYIIDITLGVIFLIIFISLFIWLFVLAIQGDTDAIVLMKKLFTDMILLIGGYLTHASLSNRRQRLEKTNKGD